MFEIEFDEINGVKYRCLVRKEDILKGKPRNPFYPSVCGVGYLGNSTIIGNKTQYDRWSNMISRCYNQNNAKYSTYGAMGVTVCDRWLCFENYLEDFTKIEGYDSENIDNLSIDKDTKIKGNKIYSLETCIFISVSENSKEMNSRVQQKLFTAISPDGNILESNNQREFAEKYNLDYKGVNAVLKGHQKTHKGWKFSFKE